MADQSKIPFASAFNKITNVEDDDFESSFDETYGDPTNLEDNTRSGFTLIAMTALFLSLIVVCKYGCIWFIDRVVLCERRNRGNQQDGFSRKLLSFCFPCWYSRSATQEGDIEDPQGQSNGDNNTTTATNTSNHSDSSSNSDDSEDANGMELVERSGIYAKRLMRILDDDEKRCLFASVLHSRNATAADILEGKDEEEKEDEPSSVVPDEESNDSSPPSSEGAGAVCCPICIQDIKVGDPICHSKRDNCHHLFHHECLLGWLGTGSTLCPYCRREIFTKSMLEDAYRKQERQRRRNEKSKKRGV